MDALIVNRRAMQYYQKQGNLAILAPDSLLQRSRIIEAMGEDDEKRGNFNAAEKKYAELHRVTGALLKRAPRNTDRIFAHAQSENRLALLAHSWENPDRAFSGFNAASALLEPLLKTTVAKPDWLQLAAYVNGNICAVSLETKRAATAALSHCQRAVALNERLIAAKPGKPGPIYDMIFHLAWLDDAWTAAGDRESAAQASKRALTLIRQLELIDADNLLWREQEMQIYVRLADKTDDPAKRVERAAFIEKASQLNRKLLARESENALWLRYRDRLKAYQQEE